MACSRISRRREVQSCELQIFETFLAVIVGSFRPFCGVSGISDRGPGTVIGNPEARGVPVVDDPVPFEEGEPLQVVVAPHSAYVHQHNVGTPSPLSRALLRLGDPLRERITPTLAPSSLWLSMARHGNSTSGCAESPAPGSTCPASTRRSPRCGCARAPSSRGRWPGVGL